MLETALRNAISAVIQARLSEVTDRILRVEVSKDWPIAEALLAIDKKIKVRVLVRRPFLVSQFDGLLTTKNAGTATGWRNQKPRGYGIVIVGSSTGNLDAGLKDVKSVDRRMFVEKWREGVLSSFNGHNDLNKEEVKKLFTELFGFVADGALPAIGLEKYVALVLSSPSVATIYSSLWEVGLMSDPRALDRGMAVSRVRRNQELVESLRTSDDQRIDRLLEKALESSSTKQRTVAQRAIEFREKSDPLLLKEIDLPTLEDIFTVTTVAPTRSMGMIELLNEHHERPNEVVECLTRIAEDWKLDEILEFVEAEYASKDGKKTVRLELSPAIAESTKEEGEQELAHLWTGATESTSILAAQCESINPEGLGPRQEHLAPDGLSKFDVAKNEVAAYLNARANLRQFEPWLERDGLWLLLLHEDARTAVRAFIGSWSLLAAAASSVEDGAGFIERVQVLETVQGPLDGDDPIWIALGPLHPFRLDPLLRAAEQIAARIAGAASIARLGDALQWTMDRCFPAYPTLHRKDKTLALSSSRGLVVYRKDAAHYLPAARDSSGLDRMLRAIEGFSPWLQPGMSILAIDPPLGGGVSRALEQARHRESGRRIFAHHLATGDDADPLDGFNGDLRYLPRVGKLSDAENLPPVNVIVRFVPESPSAGEAAGANWQATRGTHLALEIGDAVQGPFESGPSTRIKIDPRAGNIVVRRIQDLYARFKGGRPVLATIRPMLQTDDAPVLSRLAAETDWVIFAAPGPLGLISPRTINNTLRFVGRANMGNYGLYAYASDDLFPVRRHFESYFRKTPVATLPPEKMVDLLVEKAQESGNAVLFASLGSVPAQVASLVALDIAQEDAKEDEHVFVLSLDDMGWTRAWLQDGLRADFLIVKIGSDGKVLFRVVESKSKEAGEPVPCHPTQDIYAEALGQVTASLNAIKDVTAAPQPSLDEDLRFASLVEHLMASVLSKYDQLQGEKRRRVFDVVNALSRRELVPSFEALAVLTQAGVNKPREVRRVDDETKIVWAGALEIARTFKVEGTVPAFEPGPSVEPVRAGERNVGAPSASDEAREAVDAQQEQNVAGEDPTRALARGFIAAARIHGIAVAQSDPVYLQAGPSLFAVGILLREGAAIQPLRARLGDIARDIGLGDRAHEIDVENDEKPRTVRVLLPRPDRQFPSLPRKPESLVAADGYLPISIGQTVDGRNWVSPVESWPHMLVAGTTGSGKTTFIRSILRQLGGYGADKLKVIVVDGKGDTDYLGLLPASMFPEQFPDVQLGHTTAVAVLNWAIGEMEARREKIVELARRNPTPQGVKATDLYRAALKERRTPEIAPLILVIDEFADIMLAGRKSAEEFEGLVQRVSQVGRSRLIHLLLATQRPDKETIRGAIKANLNARAVFRLPTQADSLTVLGQAGAERLMLHGDMLFQHGTGMPQRLQGYSV